MDQHVAGIDQWTNWNNAKSTAPLSSPAPRPKTSSSACKDSDLGGAFSNVLEMPVWDDLQAPEATLVNDDDDCFNTRLTT